MTDYISREDFIAAREDVYCKNCDRRKNGKGKMVYEIGDVPCRACDIRCVLDDVEIYPASDVAPVVHGRWIDRENDKWECSECGRIMWFSPRLDVKPSDYRFCPNCGARMDMDEEAQG